VLDEGWVWVYESRGSGLDGLEGDAADAVADWVFVVELLRGLTWLQAVDGMAVAYFSPMLG
jgi:hypothetical protein